MTDAPRYHCENCNAPVTLRRREWDNRLLVGCDCEERLVKISRKSPESWTEAERERPDFEAQVAFKGGHNNE